ncbi:MAG: ABC transporter permease [Gammaproteobacteria bacterium]|nr:ABC transporter permease [Gammaproteobacteria bacterium]
MLNYSINSKESDQLGIIIGGRLDFSNTAKIWQEAFDALKNNPKEVIINAEKLEYCDGAGIALLLEIKKRQTEAARGFQLIGLNEEIRALMKVVTDGDASVCAIRLHPTLRFNLGALTVRAICNVRDNLSFVGILSSEIWHVIRSPKGLRWLDFWRAVEDIGPGALPIIILIGFLVGLISSFQSAIPLGQFGTQIYVINLVSLGLVKEMGPLMTAVLLISRTASSFAAELGAMKINREIDALTTMGLEPVCFLVVPRVLAAVFMTPLLNLFLIFFGLVGCALVMMHLGYNLEIFRHQLMMSVSLSSFLAGLIKTFVFGIVVAAIGCMHGLRAAQGPSGVGRATTKAVVSGIIMLVIVDGVFAVLYYVLGI